MRAAALSSLALALVAGGRAAAEEEAASAAVVAQAEEDPEKDAGAASEPDETQAPETQTPPESTGDTPAGVEVLTVRGRTAGAIETDVPSSMTQFDASTIQALGAQDVSDLARVTPNVNIVQPGATQATFFVRGIGLQSFDANATGAVTIFQDDVALDLPAIQTGQLYDIHQVEIVRGPQGTGPFRNASGGAIRVASNLPTGNYGASLRATLGRYAADGGQGAHHGMIQDYEGYVEMPVVQDALSTRFAFRLRNSEPYQTNDCANALPFELREPRPKGQDQAAALDAVDICGERGEAIFPNREISRVPVGLEHRVDNEDNWAARGFLRFQPPDTELDLVLNAHGSRLDEDQTYGQAIGTAGIREGSFSRSRFFGGSTGNSNTPDYWEADQRDEFLKRCTIVDCRGPVNVNVDAFERELAKKRPLDSKPYRGDYNRAGKTTRDAWGTYLSGKAQWNEIDLFGLASYDHYERFRDQDTDFTPDILFEVIEDDDAWQTYEELSAGGELGFTLLEWELGGYFLQESLDDESTTLLANDTRIERVYGQDTTSFGTWGQFTWDILDEVTLEGGVRYNWERKQFQIDRRLFIFDGPTPIQSAGKQEETWTTPTGSLVLTYHFSEDTSAFAKYTRGFKAGHFNALASEDVDRPPAEPEYNDAWEAGFSGAWFDRRLSATAAYFYYRYQDYQIFLFRDVADEPPVLEIINASQAENYGVEVEGRLFPLRGWVPRMMEDLALSANFGWLHGEFLDFQIRNTLPTGTGDAVPVTIDFSGQSLLSSPQFKVAGSAVWTFDFNRFGAIIPRYDFSWTDDVFYGLNEGRGTAVASLAGAPRLPEFAIGQPAYWIHNLRLGYRTPTGNVEFAIWCRNVADKVYKTYAFDATNFSQVVLNFTGQPRTIGFDVLVSF